MNRFAAAMDVSPGKPVRSDQVPRIGVEVDAWTASATAHVHHRRRHAAHRKAGIHSGDSACVIRRTVCRPPPSRRSSARRRELARELNVKD